MFIDQYIVWWEVDMKSFLWQIKCTVDYLLEKILCIILRIKRKKEDLLSEEDFYKIKQIESLSYPKGLQGYQECRDLQDFVRCCDCVGLEQIYYLCDGNWYFIAIRHLNYIHLKDFASSNKRCSEITNIISWLFDNFKRNKIKVLARESTSYQIMSAFKDRKIVFLSDKRIVMNDEFFHEITFKALKKRKKTNVIK